MTGNYQQERAPDKNKFLLIYLNFKQKLKGPQKKPLPETLLLSLTQPPQMFCVSSGFSEILSAVENRK